MAMWLAALISLLFLAEAAWRIEYAVVEATSEQPPYSETDRASAIFNAVNFLLFALIGALCLIWPHVAPSSPHEQHEQHEQEKEKGKGKDQL